MKDVNHPSGAFEFCFQSDQQIPTANMNMTNDNVWQCMTVDSTLSACCVNDFACQVKMLVEFGKANPLSEDRWHQTPLDEARHVGALPVISYLQSKVAGKSQELCLQYHWFACQPFYSSNHKKSVDSYQGLGCFWPCKQCLACLKTDGTQSCPIITHDQESIEHGRAISVYKQPVCRDYGIDNHSGVNVLWQHCQLPTSK